MHHKKFGVAEVLSPFAVATTHALGTATLEPATQYNAAGLGGATMAPDRSAPTSSPIFDDTNVKAQRGPTPHWLRVTVHDRFQSAFSARTEPLTSFTPGQTEVG